MTHRCLALSRLARSARAALLLAIVLPLSGPAPAAGPATAPAVAPAAIASVPEAISSKSLTPTVERTQFDHFTTTFELVGKHRDVPCEECHVSALFKGTPRDCASCHGLGAHVHAVAKPVNHILSTNRCDGCHTPVSFNPAVDFDHADVRGTCSSCHFNGGPAQGMSPTHILTNLECDACHSTIGWTGAIGASLPVNHLPTTQACSLCHRNGNDFSVGVMDHLGITSGCATCHAQGLAFANMAPPVLVQPPANHVPFGTSACEGCHLASVFTTFAMANVQASAPPGMVHSATATATCASCHGAGLSWAGTPATVTFPAGHVATASADCSGCHLLAASFRFANASGTAPPAMVHALVASLACSSCHERGSGDIGVPATVLRPLLKSSGAAHVATGECSTCHFNTTSFKGATDLPANHIPLTAGAAANCSACHAGPADYSSYTMDHSQVTATCSTCHAAGLSFANMAPPVLRQPPAGHVPFGQAECSACHAASLFTTFQMTNTSAAAPPAMVHTAVPGTACGTCHGPALAWSGSPATITSSNTGTAGQHVPLPAGVACESCHLAASVLPGGFAFANASGAAPPAMVHSVVAGIGCDQCHGAGKSFAGVPAVVTTSNRAAMHVPLAAASACTACHLATYASFQFANSSTAAAPGMVHSAAAGAACSACHEAGLSWLGSPATLLRPPLKASGLPHVTTGECSDCHLNTASFKGASDLPANHIPLPAADNGNCALCHSNAADYSSYAMNHANIASNCAQCHAAGLSFANIAAPALKAPPANHVPYGTTACEGCHAAGNFASFAMANVASVAPPGMVHSLVGGKACATCHASGMAWVGMPATLTPTNPGAAAPHVPVPAGAACEGCHLAGNTATGGFAFNNASGTAAPAMVHTLVATLACSGCHETGKLDLGLPATIVRPQQKASGAPHVPSGECNTCHFSASTFKGASDLPTNHIPLLAPATVNCVDCHSGAPTDYSTYAMNHADVSATCTTCHATGKSFQNMAPPALKTPPAGHVPTGTAECSACHSPIDFNTFQIANASAAAPPAMVHSAVPGAACAGCHGPTLAWIGTPATLTASNTGTASPHAPLPAGAACEGCHLASGVLPGGFAFANASGTAPPAMVHSLAASIACDQCHAAGKSFAGSPATKTVPANHVPFPSGTPCTSCHAAANFTTFVFVNASTTAAPGMVHTAVAAAACSGCHEKGLAWAGNPATVVRPALKASGLPHVSTGECSTCHSNTTSFKGASDLPANHIPLPAADNGNCLLCHASAPDYAPYVMNHVNITSNCAQCHAAGLSFANIAPPALKAPPANHVPFAPGACEGCHAATNFTTFAMTNRSTTSPPGMVHAAANTAACSTCHAAGLAWAGVPATVTLPAGHVATKGAECTTCHLGTVTFKFTNASGTAPPAMIHAVVASLACSGCHEAGKVDIGLPATVTRPLLKASGAPHIATGECNTCHFNTTSFKGASDLPTNHIPLLSPATVNCLDCHAAAPGDYSTYAMNHADVAVKCSTCHAAGKSFQNMASPALKQPPANHVPFGASECSACHNPTGFSTFQMTNTSAAAPPAMVHAAAPASGCATCHASTASWVGVPATLTNAHTGTANPHVPLPAGVACESCHAASATLPGGFAFSNASGGAPPAMVHAQVASIACDQCHAAGKAFAGSPATRVVPANHVPFPAGTACTGCHSASNFTTFAFANASTTAPSGMVHTLVAAIACSTCHEAGRAWAGTPATLVRPALKANGQTHVTTGECSTCHFNTTSFKGATDLPVNHIPLPAADNNNCTLCHAGAPDYAPYTMNHANIASNCAQCHAAGMSFLNMAPPTLKVTPAGHVPFGATACERCHSPSNFTTFLMANASGGAPPAMVHAAVTGTACATCHGGGLTWIGTPATRTLTNTGTAGPHVPLPAGAACESCHLASATATGGFALANASGAAPPAMVHAVVASIACDQCHAAGKAFAGSPATRVLPANHVPYPAGTACTGCHSAGNFTTFVFVNASTTAPAGMVHTLVASLACSTCHESGKTWAGAPATVVRPALKASGQQHVPAGECSTCHFNTTSFKGATDLPANHLPLPAADNSNCALCHSNPGDYSVGTMNHVNIAANCAQCHAAGKSFANMAPPLLVLPPASHVPFGTVACEACHSAGNFATGGFKITSQSTTSPPGMVHAAVAAQACAACHASGNTWLGSPLPPPTSPKHVPFGSAACEACHRAASTATGGWKFTNASGTVPPAMVHAAVNASACDQCHGPGLSWAGTPATVTTSNRALAHVPYPAGTACTGCHTASNFTSFVITNASKAAAPGMVHTLVTSSACSTCHEKGKAWLGSPATILRPALKASGQAHVAAGECSTCHFNTTSFKGATDLPANHIPLPAADNSACTLCHSNSADYSVYAMNHVNITSNCIQCHGFGLSFANMAPPTLKAPPSGATGHIPSNKPNGTSDIACELCHTPTVFTTFAGTVMKHANVKAMTCMSCHEIGMTWKTNTGVRLWVRDSANHHKGQDCDGSGCHSARDKMSARRAVALGASQKAAPKPALSTGTGGAGRLGGGAGVNHQRLVGTACASCHAAASGTGKLAGHMATSDRCEGCHSTGSWGPVLRVDHTQVLGSCTSCHDGRLARGKATSHIASGTNCASCHTTVAWTPARFDHAGVAAHTCTTCHDSLHAMGKPLNHVPTSAQCDTCHGALGWKPALMDHATLNANCATCHNNNVALGVPVGHMGTRRDCATCHSYPDWAAMHFVHASAAYPGEHRAAPACAACHTANTDQIAWASPADAGSCGGCHAKDFNPVRHPKVVGGANYTASELHDCSGACHVYSDAALGTVSKSLPGPYHRLGNPAFKH